MGNTKVFATKAHEHSSMCHASSSDLLVATPDPAGHACCPDTRNRPDDSANSAPNLFTCSLLKSYMDVEVMDLSTDDDGADSDLSTDFWYSLESDDGCGFSRTSSSSTSSSPFQSLWGGRDVDDESDESDVIARLTGEDWQVVEEMVRPMKTLRKSALVTIIMPNQLKTTSRRGGRRGCRMSRACTH